MIILNVNTDDPIRVIRKYETKPARLIAITCPSDGKKYHLIYSLEI